MTDRGRTGDLQARRRRRRRSWRGRWISGIRVRVLAIALIPSVVLFITGVIVVVNLISQGVSARDLSGYYVQTNTSSVGYQSAIEQERTTSELALGGDRQAQASLQARWDATNMALAKLSSVTPVFVGVNQQAYAAAVKLRDEIATGLPTTRRDVQKGQATITQVDSFYSQFTQGSALIFLQSTLKAPSPAAAVNEMTALDLYEVPDLHSRAFALGAGWAARGMVPQEDRLVLARLIGSYQNQLQAVDSRLPQSVQATAAKLQAGSAWKTATAGEDDLTRQGKLAVPFSSWLAAENTVSAGLLGLWGDDLASAEAAAQATANQTVSRSILVGSLVLVWTLAALAAAIVLARGLVRRLLRLRSRTLELAEVTLPSIVRRIGDGEPVDVMAELGLSGYGRDEIGQVAEAFNIAQRTVVTIATAEASTRAGISKVFLDIAHRSQLVVHRQLELLDVAEAKQSDPEHLELLFQLDHLATRARRNAENLLILGGGQPSRKWRRPAGLEDIVRSAVSETEHFARVSTVRLPSVQVQGAVVGDLIHLLAELVDNATVFSPPEAAVTVRGNVVGKGVIVEVEDQGLGIDFAERERLNETLRNPPGFQSMALSGQRHLGLFVVGQLAQRHGITVSLQESAYGGVRAIVLIPSGVVGPDGAADGEPRPAGRPGRHEQPRQPADEAAHAPVPQPRGTGSAGPQGSVPPAELPLSSSADPRPATASSAPWDAVARPVPRTPGRGRAPLPQRERLANLAPGLRPDTREPDNGRPRRARSAEEARGSMSAFQQGTRLGRGTPRSSEPMNTNGGQ
jgi:signal transduction histidine kinase